MAEAIYFDTCIFIELLQKSNKNRFEACEALRAKAEKSEKGELVIVTSAVEVNKFESDALPEEQSKLILNQLVDPRLRPLQDFSVLS